MFDKNGILEDYGDIKSEMKCMSNRFYYYHDLPRGVVIETKIHNGDVEYCRVVDGVKKFSIKGCKWVKFDNGLDIRTRMGDTLVSVRGNSIHLEQINKGRTVYRRINNYISQFLFDNNGRISKKTEIIEFDYDEED